MNIFSIEHSKIGYWIDFVVYVIAVVLLGAGLLFFGPLTHWPTLFGLSLAGVGGWTLIEYLIHRFVLHGVEPFRSWHAEHHARPVALISAPTVLTGTLFAVVIFVPGLLLGSVWQAVAITLGVTVSYLAYSVLHHAIHHWRANSVWLWERKLWHAQHHHALDGRCYGVTTSFWDWVFRSATIVIRVDQAAVKR